jgi:hypothetical protein
MVVANLSFLQAIEPGHCIYLIVFEGERPSGLCFAGTRLTECNHGRMGARATERDQVNRIAMVNLLHHARPSLF